MLQKLRPLYEQFSIPIGLFSLKLGLYPDFWTWFSLLSAAACGFLIAKGFFVGGFFAMLSMNLADMLDGATARAGHLATPFGTVFDHVVDRYAEFFIMAGFLMGGWISSEVALFTASGVVMASYVRAKAESVGKVANCNVGLAGRQEKLILMYLSIILLMLQLNFVAQGVLVLVGIISHVTAIQRVLFARQQILVQKS
jgi:phosphatidylglycerophosphate synthase